MLVGGTHSDCLSQQDGLHMLRPTTAALVAAVALTTGSGVVIGVDVFHQALHSNVLTQALFHATAIVWGVWLLLSVRESFVDTVEQARRELHAAREVRHLKSIRDGRAQG